MKKRFLLIAAFIIAALAPIAPTVDAGNTLVPNDAFTCTQTYSYQNRLCYDISRAQIFVFSAPGANGIYNPAQYSEYLTVPQSAASIPPGFPSLPWRADDFECNAGAGNVTTFRINNTWTFTIRTKNFGEVTRSWYNAPVSTTMRDIIAYAVNINGAGNSPNFECIVVP